MIGRHERRQRQISYIYHIEEYGTTLVVDDEHILFLSFLLLGFFHCGFSFTFHNHRLLHVGCCLHFPTVLSDSDVIIMVVLVFVDECIGHAAAQQREATRGGPRRR
jgi:hypothetical protein